MPLFTEISKSIDHVFAEYLEQPLLYLREYNLQARLWQILLNNVKHECVCQLVDVGFVRPGDLALHKVNAVQMEMKVGIGEKSDIIIFRTAGRNQPIFLRRQLNGVLDVLASVRSQDVAAVIEIKAACSFDFEQRHKFRQDVRKLLAVQSRGREEGVTIQCHFVLFDKSIATDQNMTFPVAHVSDWHLNVNNLLCREILMPSLMSIDYVDGADAGVHVWDLLIDVGIVKIRHRLMSEQDVVVDVNN